MARLLPLALLLLLATPAAGQDHAGRAGDKSLTFSTSGFGASSGSVGFRFWRSNTRALVLDLDLAAGRVGEDDGGADVTTTNLGVTLFAGYERHVPAAKRVSPFFRLEFGVGYGRSRRDREDGRVSLDGSTLNEYSLSVRPGLGAEYRFNDHLSLALVQRLHVEAVHSGREQTSGGDVVDEADVTRLMAGLDTGVVFAITY